MKHIFLLLLVFAIFLLGTFISCAEKNEVPEATTISGPAEAWLGAEDTFLVTGIDPDGDSLVYLVDWGDGNFTRWSDYYASGDTAKFLHQFWAETTYAISAMSQDLAADTSNWSEPHNIEVFSMIIEQWEYWGAGMVAPPAVDDDGTIYCCLGDGLCALDPSGNLKWSYLCTGYFLSSPSIADDGTIYVGSGDGEFYAFLPDGTIKWTYPTVSGKPLTAGAIGSDGTIYFGSDDSCLYALNPNGNLAWVFHSTAEIWSSPIIGQNDYIYFGTKNGYLNAVSTDDPDTLFWSTKLSSSDLCIPGAIADNGVIYATTNDELWAVNPDGSISWHIGLGQDLWSTNKPVIGTDNAIFLGGQESFLSISSNGIILWQYPKPCWGTSAITADGFILTPLEGFIFRLSQNGTARARTLVWVGFAPAPANGGVIYDVSTDCILYALAGSSPLANSPWPMYQHDARHTGRAGP